MSTTTNVVSHVNVEQSKRPILFRMKRESTFVGIGVDFTLDGRTFWRLSHFHSFSFLSYHYTIIIVQCQYGRPEKVSLQSCKVRGQFWHSICSMQFSCQKFGIGFAVLICRKLLQHKHLHQVRRARLALSPLAARVYV